MGAPRVPGAERAAENVREPGHVDDGAADAARGVHLFDGRVKKRIDAIFAQQAGIVVRRTRIRAEILGRPELHRVDEDAGDDAPAMQVRSRHEARMSHVQVAHGGYERDALAREPPARDGCAELRDPRDCLHRSENPWWRRCGRA